MKSVFNCTVRLLYKLIKSPVRYLKWTGVYCDLFILSSIIMYCVLHPQQSFWCVLNAVICSTLTEEIIEFSGEWLIYPFIYLSIYSSSHLFLHASIFSFTYLFILLLIYLFIYSLIYLFIYLYIYSSTHLSVNLLIYLLIYTSIYSSTCISIHLLIYLFICSSIY